MALIIEDGTGLSNAQSYVDTTFVNAYFTLRGITFISTEALIIQAMDYIEATYSQSYVGVKYTNTQSLAFPRLIDGSSIYPERLKSAVCELTHKASLGTLMEDSTQKIVREQVGPITTQYSEYSDAQKQYAMVYQLLSPWLSGSTTSHVVSRA